MWHLVNGLLNSAQLMISVFMLLMLSIYIFACLGIELITKDERLKTHPDTAEIVNYYFPSLPLTMVTLIQFITLDSIGAIYFPIVCVRPRLIFFFGPILMILPITLMNLVTAVLVEHGLENAQLETAEENRNRARYIKKSVVELGELFEELDRDRNGLITPFELNMVPPENATWPQGGRDSLR
ncbi:Cacna1b [Symbiodinium natans]|uniref:Cacna1b protein n=1 Tax=Symbiodinium natans TaxID=878477 RepID=A0A812KVM9_9DINO|nr:Cacna1b [Symbiodinium natans]